ncbi:MAG: ribonuclease [Aquamicrobium sp.]|nr:ribonuclease [Aquamicrobium sp.]
MFNARIIQAPLLAVLLVASACAPSASQQPDLPTGDGYDFFVLSLSWSPSYCAAEGPDANRQQCAAGRDHAFVVHGLWPQFESGWPEFCDSAEPARVPDATVQQMLDIMPSAGLVGHQWRKHGSCSGMSQQDYFSVVRAARKRIEVPDRFARMSERVELEPDDVEADFIAANPGMPEDGVAVTCDGRFLREVRICMTKDLEFRPCAEVDARACWMPRALMPAPGG